MKLFDDLPPELDIHPHGYFGIEPDEMWVYEINEDDSLGLSRHKRDEPLPDNRKELPVEWDGQGIMYYDGGKFTQKVKTKEELNFEAEASLKIEKKMRELAIQELKKEGKLPANYKEK